MTIRGKLLDLKHRLSDRRMYSIVLVVIGAVSIWGIYQYKHAANLRQLLDNQYNRAFYDLVGYVDNVEVLLAKSLISTTSTRTASTLQEAWRQANMAQNNLGQIPVSQQTLGNTSKFLTQVGDLAYSLNTQEMSGKTLSNEQYQVLEKLHGYAVSLEKSLADLQNQLSGGRMRWGELEKKGTSIFKRTSTTLPQKQFENIDKTFQEYPTLIYDGPFSDHMVTSKPRGLTGNEVSRDVARKVVTEFFGADKVASVQDNGGNDNDPIKTYSFNVAMKGAPKDQLAQIEVTRKGGHVIWMIYNRASSGKGVSIDKAKEMGRKFLDSRGFKNMKDTYYLSQDGTATINYAYTEGDVVVYSDLIKLKIALDNGEVIGFEGKGFLSAHTERKIPKPKISMEEARKKINAKVKISSEGMAIIPTEFKTEVFTYEFKGKLNDNDFLVYINAETGQEESILMIVNTPNGILTM